MFAYDNTMKRTIICILLWTLVIGWMGTLVYMSAQPADVSGRMSGNVLRDFYDNADENTVDKERFDKDLFVRANQGKLRRMAHLLTFGVLGILSASASLYTFGRSVKGYSFPFVIAIMYSIIDELIQLAAPGRAFEWEDLCRDAIGSISGILFIYIVLLIKDRIDNRCKSKRS